MYSSEAGTRCALACANTRRDRSHRRQPAAEDLLAPLLKIADVRTDTRMSSSRRPWRARAEQLVDSGNAAVAFSLYPVSVEDLMSVSDARDHAPKSTWFEPKLRAGLLIHVI